MSKNPSRPEFTILLTCLNEEKRIGAAIESLLDERLHARGEMIVLDGGSRDRTREIIGEFVARGWPIRLLHNEGRIQSEGLNLGLRESRGAIIVRADAHGVYPPRYVERCVEMLAGPGIVNAGGIMSPVGEGPVQSAIALAMRHPVGVGDAKYHLGGLRGEYEGVYLGAFKREIFDRVGGYDPAVHPNEDADLNMRIRAAGGRIWLDGSLRVAYYPRESFPALFVQYFRYGRGRSRTTLKHRRFTSWRQVLPPLLVASLVAALALSARRPAFLLWIGLYLGAVLAAAGAGRFEPAPPLFVRFLVFPAFVVMHTAWGLGFWAGLARGALGKITAIKEKKA